MNKKPKLEQIDQISTKTFLIICWESKFLIFKLTFLFTFLALIIAIMLPNKYTSSSLLKPDNIEDSLSASLGQFSTIASFSGIELPDEVSTKTDEAVARLQSFEFFSQYFLPNIKLENLMAVKKWDPIENKIIYKKRLFDEENKKWIRDVDYPKQIIPSDQEAFESFEEIFKVNIDKKTSFVTISITHKSPIIAKDWLYTIINNINESMRQEDIFLSKTYIDFLSKSQKSTNIQSLKDIASSLLEDQMQTLMLASSNQAYIFKVIDSPIAPEKKSSPSRALICILGVILGGIISILISVSLYYRPRLYL